MYSINEGPLVTVFQDGIGWQLLPDLVHCVVMLFEAWKTIVQILDDEHLDSQVQRYNTIVYTIHNTNITTN